MNKDNKFQKFIFWFLSFTWGLPITLVGSIIAIILMIGGKRPKKFGWCIYFNVGEHWGGLEFGPFFLVDSSDDFGIKCHEHGHGFQNIIMGPFFPLIVSLRSGARYWLRELKTYKSRSIYVGILCSLLICIFATGMGLGLYLEILALIIVSFVALVYAFFFTTWLVEELWAHKDAFPKYDDFWVEGQATKWGENFINNRKLVDKKE